MTQQPDPETTDTDTDEGGSTGDINADTALGRTPDAPSVVDADEASERVEPPASE